MRPVIRELLLGSQAPISPAQLFSGGRQGFWFDFVTPGVWFQDSVGITPVTNADQPTGLALDRSQNLTLGSDLITNGTFNADLTNWINVGTCTRSVVSGKFRLETLASVGNNGIRQVVTGLTVGATYKISGDLSIVVPGPAGTGPTVRWGNGNITSPTTVLFSAGVDSAYIVPAQTTITVFLLDAGSGGSATFDFDNISVKKISGCHATQTTAAARPTSKLSPSRISLDKTDDRLLITVPTGGFVGTLVLATTEGTAAYGVNIPAETWALGANTTSGTIYFPGTTIVGAICRHGAMTDAEIARCIAYLRSIGGGPAYYSGITSFANYWRNAAWLTEFVSNAFNGSTATDFSNAFTGCALDQTSVDNILVSINSNGTSGGALDMTGGTNSAPSATGAAAVTALQSRGWTVTTN